MDRRKFVKNTSLAALSIGAFGKIIRDGSNFVTDSPTTTDILGPAYRPGAPFRMNINPPDFAGIPLHLKGTIYKSDGKTPFDNCTMEIWQCLKNGRYDMVSDDYICRGQIKTKKDGTYHFITTHPVAYTINKEKTVYRAEHIHLLVSGGLGEQDLVTQIYFKGDKHIAGDRYALSPGSASRILETIKNSKNEDVIVFDIFMKKEFPLDDTAYNKMVGVYALDDKSTARLFRKGDILFLESDEQIGEAFFYKGDNQFESGAGDPIRFDFEADGRTRISGSYTDLAHKVYSFTGVRIVKYNA
jgi:catechol 1,2-dioxygenase